MNWAQRELLDRFWHRNLVLKVRQIGITTFYCLLELDTALFSPGTSVGIIAHTKDDAKKIFRDKIKFAYDRLPQDLRAVVPAKANSASEILFANGSSIYVGVTMRSATVQMLHITEYWYICAKFPQRAEEIRTGAMEAVPAGGAITIESTAMGRFGHFYELVDAAQKRGTDTIARADYRLVFLPWWKHPEYEEPGQTTLSPAEAQYFNSVQASAGRVVNAGQKTWYIAKWRALGEKVKSEYPSTIKEAFQRSVEGAYYEQQMTQARMDGRVTKVPHEPGALVHTWWDLGVGDATAIWFAQEIGREIRLIDYYENSGEGLPHYVKELTERREKLGYIYGRHIGPHDIKVREFSSGQSRIHRAKELGLDFEVAPNLPTLGCARPASSMHRNVLLVPSVVDDILEPSQLSIAGT
ncbi:MAG: hypothetical protein L0H83_05675, partial [Salinisphaera sp.]|nr:hypothetical protein [Salinisphaera sp.]